MSTFGLLEARPRISQRSPIRDSNWCTRRFETGQSETRGIDWQPNVRDLEGRQCEGDQRPTKERSENCEVVSGSGAGGW
jgi:hypothetical protein